MLKYILKNIREVQNDLNEINSQYSMPSDNF